MNFFILNVIHDGLVGYQKIAESEAHPRKASSQEITYQEFIRDYLAPNKIEMITISEHDNSETFKFRAQIQTHDDVKAHLVLPQVEGFLMKLDQAQREMGRQVSEYVPVKYANKDD
jgi:hypothetical protein